MSGNPFVCDCQLEWLPQINSVEMQEHHPRVADLSEIECRLNNQPRNDSIEAVSQVAPSDFLCSYSTHCFSLCMCCEFYACDCRMQCPDGCSCYHDSTWDTNIIQCGLRGHTDVPLLIPMDATGEQQLSLKNPLSNSLLNIWIFALKMVVSIVSIGLCRN